MVRRALILSLGVALTVLASGSAVGAKASLDEAALEHDHAVARALPGAVESAFEARGIGLASSGLDYASGTTAEPLAFTLEYPVSRPAGNDCFAIYFWVERLTHTPADYQRASCADIVSYKPRLGAPRVKRGTLLGDHYVVVYSLTPRFRHLVETTLQSAVRADH